MSDYPDTNNDGIPDAFENRRPISEILNEPEVEHDHGVQWLVFDNSLGEPSEVDSPGRSAPSPQLEEYYEKVQALLQEAEQRINELIRQNQLLTSEITRLRSVLAQEPAYIPREGATEQCAVCETFCVIKHGALEIHDYPRDHQRTGKCSGSGTLNIHGG